MRHTDDDVNLCHVPTKACAKACCADDACNTWQLETSDGDTCWIGDAGEGVGKCGPPRRGTWIGGQRHTAPAPPPAPPAPPFRNATLVAYSADPSRTRIHDSHAANPNLVGLRYHQDAAAFIDAGVPAAAAAAVNMARMTSVKVLATHSLFVRNANLC